MKILITGAKGMLGRTLMRRLASGNDLIGTDLPELDLLMAEDVNKFVADHCPQTVIHCAAMTAVDRCETERAAAFAVNADGARNVAVAAKKCRAKVIMMSTDYVFRGDLGRPYHEEDAPDPQTVYGQSKLAAERAVLHVSSENTVLRTAWLYGSGGPSFVHTMLRLGAVEGEPLKVVNDQIGNPTSADALAILIRGLLRTSVKGIVHGVCQGEATWYDLAGEIFRIKGFSRKIIPCTTGEFPRSALRPKNSRLETRVILKAGLPPLPHWKEALAQFLLEYPQG